jgi:hypothetical protein
MFGVDFARLARALTVACASATLVACGAGATEPSAPKDEAAAAGSGGRASGAQGKLQGKWEIVRYESQDPIPDEAMPLMGELFEELRLDVQGDKVVVDQKASPFVATDSSDGSFKLTTSGGMFDGATCRFVEDDEFEVDDRGEHWPGKSLLKRSR